MPNTITLTGRPISTNHAYGTVCRGRFPKRYMTHEGISLKEDYQWQAKSQWKDKPMKGEIMLEIKLFFGSKHKHDIDNYGKILLDSMAGILYEDDNQIEQMVVTKFHDKKKPRIEITILHL